MKRSTHLLVEAARKAERNHARFDEISAMSAQEIKRALGDDPAQAEPWIRSAAAHGVVEAQLRLGAMLLEGTGVKRHPESALRWFRRAAQAGNAEAMNMVGRCYENGWGVPANEGAAVEWYRRSAEAGHDWGKYNYAHMLFDGRGGLSEDKFVAFGLYLSAAEQGHARAMNLVARCLEAGWGVDADRKMAAHWYERSAQAGYFRAQFNHAGMLLEQGEIGAAIEWLQRAEVHDDEPIRRHVRAILNSVRASLEASLRDYASESPRAISLAYQQRHLHTPVWEYCGAFGVS